MYADIFASGIHFLSSNNQWFCTVNTVMRWVGHSPLHKFYDQDKQHFSIIYLKHKILDNIHNKQKLKS